jgi:predicted nuclease of predicted toxin-antitoxin system
VTPAPRVRILLDQGLPRDTAESLRGLNFDCTHVGEIGMSESSDTEILEWARAHHAIVITLDADFHAIVMVQGLSGPSVIRIRIQGLNAAAIAELAREVLMRYACELAAGCMITVKESKTTCHLLGT